jgi:RecA-family ATPase
MNNTETIQPLMDYLPKTQFMPDISNFRPAAYVGDSKARRDVIHGRLPAGKVVLLAGAGGSGKSTLLLQIAEALQNSTGPAFGGDISGAFHGFPCILMLGEDGRDTLDLRLQVIRAKQGGKPTENYGLYIPCPDLEQSARLVVRDEYSRNILPTDAFTWLEETIEAEAAVHGGVALVAIDTFTALLGVDSNSAEDVQGCYNILARLARKHDCCVIVTHHLNKGSQQDSRQKIRGSTAVVDGVRAAYVLEQVDKAEAARMLKSAQLDPDHDLLQITLQKENLGLSRKPIYYLRESDGYLRDISQLVGDQDDPEAALLAIVKQFNDCGQVVTKTGGRGLYSLRADAWPKALQSRDRIVLIANTLLQAGRLTVDPETQGLVVAVP